MRTTNERDSPRAQAKRAQILAGARRAFLAHGFGGATTNHIAAEAGVSKQTLYAYYRGKEDVLRDVLAGQFGALFAEAPENSRFPDGPQELRAALLRFSEELLRRLLDPEALALLRVIVAEVPRLPAVRALLRDALPGRLLAQVGALLEEARARNLIDVSQPDLAARLLVGSLMSYVALDGLLSPEPPRPPEEAQVRHLVDLFLRAVERNGAREESV